MDQVTSVQQISRISRQVMFFTFPALQAGNAGSNPAGGTKSRLAAGSSSDPTELSTSQVSRVPEIIEAFCRASSTPDVRCQLLFSGVRSNPCSHAFLCPLVSTTVPRWCPLGHSRSSHQSTGVIGSVSNSVPYRSSVKPADECPACCAMYFGCLPAQMSNETNWCRRSCQVIGTLMPARRWAARHCRLMLAEGHLTRTGRRCGHQKGNAD